MAGEIRDLGVAKPDDPIYTEGPVLFPVRPLRDHVPRSGTMKDSEAANHEKPRKKIEDKELEALRKKRHEELGKALVENLNKNVKAKMPTT